MLPLIQAVLDDHQRVAVADAAADAAGDASLFRPPVELAPETLARGPEQGDGIELHDAAAGEWKAMAAA